MSLTLVQLTAFVTTVEFGTFTSASIELGMSQPAVSELVKRLESELGVHLFERRGRSIVLSVAGREFLPHAQRAVEAAEAGRGAVQALRNLEGGTVTFGLLRNADFYLGADLVARFHRQHPKVRLRLLGQNSAETGEDVRSGRLEAGLVTLPIDTHGLDVEPLLKDELMCVSADPSFVKEPVALSDFLAAGPILYDAHYADSDPVRIQLSQRAELMAQQVVPNIEVEYLSTALSLAAEGFGPTIACRSAVRQHAAQYRLHAAPFAETLYDTIALIKASGKVPSAPTKRLMSLAKNAIRTTYAAAPDQLVLIDTTSRDARQ